MHVRSWISLGLHGGQGCRSSQSSLSPGSSRLCRALWQHLMSASLLRRPVCYLPPSTFSFSLVALFTNCDCDLWCYPGRDSRSKSNGGQEGH